MKKAERIASKVDPNVTSKDELKKWWTQQMVFSYL